MKGASVTVGREGSSRFHGEGMGTGRGENPELWMQSSYHSFHMQFQSHSLVHSEAGPSNISAYGKHLPFSALGKAEQLQSPGKTKASERRRSNRVFTENALFIIHISFTLKRLYLQSARF